MCKSVNIFVIDMHEIDFPNNGKKGANQYLRGGDSKDFKNPVQT